VLGPSVEVVHRTP
jgi:hypothetical protein